MSSEKDIYNIRILKHVYNIIIDIYNYLVRSRELGWTNGRTIFKQHFLGPKKEKSRTVTVAQKYNWLYGEELSEDLLVIW